MKDIYGHNIKCVECERKIDFRKRVYMVDNDYLCNVCHGYIKELLNKSNQLNGLEIKQKQKEVKNKNENKNL